MIQQDRVALHIPFATTSEASLVSSARWTEASYPKNTQAPNNIEIIQQ